MTGATVRTGEHPFDQALAGSWLWHWLWPALQVLGRHWMRIAPVALAYGLYVWLLPKLLLAGPFDSSQWRQVFDAIQVSAVSCALMALGYAQLARAEGTPHGLGFLPAAGGIASRLALVTGFWLLFGVLLGWLLRGVFALLMKSSSFTGFWLWLFGKLEWWSIPFVVWLFAPLWALLGVLSALTQIRAIRAEEPLVELVVDSFRRVFADLLRIAVPAWAIAAAILFPGWLFIEKVLDGALAFFVRTGWGGVIGLAAVGMALALPFWWVLERVYLPELGIEEDLEAETPAAAAPAAEPMSLAEQLARLRSEEGEVAAARRLANWIRARQRPQAELAPLLRSIGDPSLVALELSSVAVEWSQSGRPGELPWLVGEALSLHPAFLMDRPDQVLGIARKLTVGERADLATCLLLGFLKQHRGHAEHLSAGLQLARILATHSNNVAGARKLLTQLAELYPDDPQPAQLLKQLGN